MTNEKMERIRSLREGSMVERAHTIPHNGGYSNGFHTYNLMMLIFELHPDPSRNLLREALVHDSAERWTGDIPNVAKSDGQAYTEDRIRRTQFDMVHLDPEDIKWLKACDKLEFWLWCRDQVYMGNKHVINALTNTDDWFKQNRDDCPAEVLDFVAQHDQKRGREIYDL